MFGTSSEVINSVNETNEIAKHYLNNRNLDSARITAYTALLQAHENNYSYGTAKSQHILGMIAYRQDSLGISLPFLLKSLSNYIKDGSTPALSDQANICITLGKIYRIHNKYEEAIKFYDKGIDYAYKSEDYDALTKLLYNKALVLRKINNLPEAADLLIEKLRLINDIDKPESPNIIGRLFAYNQLGLIYRDLGEFIAARNYYQKMIELVNQTDPERYARYRGQAHHNIAVSYQHQGLLLTAKESFHQALIEKEKIGRTKDLFITYIDLAELNLILDQDQEATILCAKALELYAKLPQIPDYFKVYHIMSKCTRSQGNTAEALYYQDIYVQENSKYNETQENIIAEGDKYKIDLITSNFFNELNNQQEQAKFHKIILICLIIFTSYFAFVQTSKYLIKRDLKKALQPFLKNDL